MSLVITSPSFDRVYTLYAWRDNNICLVFTQGEGLTSTDGTVAHVKAPKFQLKDARGVIDLTSCSVSLALTRPDGSEDLLACSSTSDEAAQGIISCPITASATAIAGQADGEIRVLSASSGNPTGIIKFFGIHFQIYKGVSDNAAEQSTQFSALTAELQKVALLTPEGTAEMDDTLEHGGTNPVASGIIYDNTMKYKNIQASEINDSTRADYVYHGIDEVGYYFVMICVRNTDGSRKTQYKFYTSSPTSLNNGKIVFRTYNNTTSTWGDWTPIGNTANIADDAVTNEKIADDAITNEKIRDNEISLEKLDFDIPDISEGIISKAIIENYDSLTPDVTFNAINDDVAEYLNSAAYTFTLDNAYNSNNYTSTNIPDPMDSSVSELPNGGMINVPTGGSKIVIYDTVENTQWVDDLSGSTYTIKNLIPNRLYTYIIKDSNGDTLRSGSCKASGQVRFIDAGNVTLYSLSSETTEQAPLFNVRDIGGWECDGGHLKYGLIYRGSQLNGTARNPSNHLRGISISTKQQKFFKDFLGIKDEIDLRQIENDPDAGNSETAGDDGVYGTADDIADTALGLGVDYILVPVKPYYNGVLLTDATQNNRYATLIKRVASDIKQNKPCYIHCMEGADRTGTLCMLIEAICGVSRNSIERDYELTSFSKKYSNTRNTRLRTNANWWGNLIQYVLNSTTGDSFRDKIIDYVLRIGVTIDEINTIRAGLIEGTPEKIKNPYSNVSVTTTLTDVYADKDIANVVKFQPLEINLYPKDGYVLSSVTLTMGGSDIKATCYSDGGRIRIPKVTGDVVITAQAVSITGNS